MVERKREGWEEVREGVFSSGAWKLHVGLVFERGPEKEPGKDLTIVHGGRGFLNIVLGWSRCEMSLWQAA